MTRSTAWPESSPSPSPAPAPRRTRVLLLERQEDLRRALGDLLRRKGLEVTDAAPGGVDLYSRSCPWDAVVFSESERPLVRRRRWLFGYRPARGKTRMVAMSEAPRPLLNGPLPAPPAAVASAVASGVASGASSDSPEGAPFPESKPSGAWSALDRDDVDATVPYPVSVSALINAILGEDPRAGRKPAPSRPRARFVETTTDPGFRRRPAGAGAGAGADAGSP